MGEVVYRSQVSVTRERGPLRSAVLPALDQPVLFGVHSAVAEHYGIAPDQQEPHTSTLDYLVAAAAGWLTGTFGGALEARGFPAAGGRLRAEAVGEIELDAKVLVVKRIHVTYHLAVDQAVMADETKRATIDRVLSIHAERCPVARTIGGCVDISTSVELVPAGWTARTLPGGMPPREMVAVVRAGRAGELAWAHREWMCAHPTPGCVRCSLSSTRRCALPATGTTIRCGSASWSDPTATASTWPTWPPASSAATHPHLSHPCATCWRADAAVAVPRAARWPRCGHAK